MQQPELRPSKERRHAQKLSASGSAPTNKWSSRQSDDRSRDRSSRPIEAISARHSAQRHTLTTHAFPALPTRAQQSPARRNRWGSRQRSGPPSAPAKRSATSELSGALQCELSRCQSDERRDRGRDLSITAGAREANLVSSARKRIGRRVSRVATASGDVTSRMGHVRSPNKAGQGRKK